MSYKHFWTSAGIIALVIFIGFVLSVPHTRDGGVPAQSTAATTSLPAVTVHDVYKKGVHTLTGSLEVPSACVNVTADAMVNDRGILIAITTQAEPGVCLQVPTRETFIATVAAPARLPISATVNGSPAMISDS